MALTGNRKRELKAKAAIALSLASMRLDKMGRSFKSEPTCDFEKVQNSDLSTETVNYFRKAISDEYVYMEHELPNRQNPYVQNYFQFADSAYAAIDSFNFKEATLSGDKNEIERAAAIYVSRAFYKKPTSERFLYDVQQYVSTNREIASQLLDLAFKIMKRDRDRKHVLDVEKFNNLRKALDEAQE